MANDVFDDGPPKRHGKAVNKVAASYDSLADSKKEAADVASPDLGALKNFEDMADAQETLAQQIKRSTKEIIDQAKQIGSLKSQVDNVTGAVKGFGQHLQKTASVTHQYSLAMKEFKQGTEAYTQSLALSTDKLGKASAETTKFMEATQQAYNKAYDVAKLYGIEVDQVRQQMDKLQTTFASQLSVTDNHGKALVRLTKDAMMFARTAGIDTSEAVQRLDERLQGSTMTMEEARVEQILVMKEMDKYKRSLQALGKEALKTGNITSKDLVKGLQAVRQQFKMGSYDAGSFAKAFTSITMKGKKLGLTTEQIKGTMTGFGAVIKSLSSQENLTGMLGSLDMLEKFGKLEGPIGKFARSRQKLVATGKESKFSAGAAIMEKAEGSTESMRLLLKILKEKFPSILRAHMLKDTTGSSLQASVVNEMIETGSYEKMFAKQAGMTKEEKAKEAEAFSTPMEKLVKEAHTAQSTRHKTAKALDDFHKTATQWMEKYWPLMMALQGAQGLRNLGGGRYLPRRGGPTPRGGGPAAGGWGPRGGQRAPGGPPRGPGGRVPPTRRARVGAWASRNRVGGRAAGAAGIGLGVAGMMGLDKKVGLGHDYGGKYGKTTSDMAMMAGPYGMLASAAYKGSSEVLHRTTEKGLYGSRRSKYGRPGKKDSPWQTGLAESEKMFGGIGYKYLQGEAGKMNLGDILKDQAARPEMEKFTKLRAKEIAALEEKLKQQKWLSDAEEAMLVAKKKEKKLIDKKLKDLKEVTGDYTGPGPIAELQAELDPKKTGAPMGGKSVLGSAGGAFSAMSTIMRSVQAKGVAKELSPEKSEGPSIWKPRLAAMGPTVVSPPPEYAASSKQSGKDKVEIVISGDNVGSSGEETFTPTADGGGVITRHLNMGVVAKVKKSGETVKKEAYNAKRARMNDASNKQSR